MKKVLALSLYIVIFLFSCDNVSDFLFETDQSIAVRSIDNGSTYRGGESLPITITFDRAIVPEILTVTIFDDEGLSWGETQVSIPLEEDRFDTSLLVPHELPEGKYIIHIRVFENEKEISFKEIIIFKTDSNYAIEQLISIPNETKAGNDVLVRASILYPETGDPFLRWKVNGTLLREGLLSQGMDSLYWLAEKENGLYRISLEVFPEIVDASMVSSIFASAEIVVTDHPLRNSDSLLPEEAYSLLFHFDGDLEPVMAGDFKMAELGQIKVGSLKNQLVYEFSENSGIAVTGSIIPQKSGVVTPFSINGRISLSEIAEPGRFLTLSAQGQKLFSVDVNSSGNLVFTAGDEQSISRFAIKERTDFSLQLIPLEAQLEIRWFYNGNDGGKDLLFTNFPLPGETQTLLIGGDETRTSATMILDELGFYLGDKADSFVDGAQFSRVKRYALKEHLIDAEGFDDREGDRMIEPGEKFLISTFPLSVRNTEIVLSFSHGETEDSWNVILEDVDKTPLAIISDAYSVEEVDSNTGLVSRKLRLSLEFNDLENVFELKSGGDHHKVLNRFNPGDMLSLFLETDVENKRSYPLDFYIIFTNIDSVISEMIVTNHDIENLL